MKSSSKNYKTRITQTVQYIHDISEGCYHSTKQKSTILFLSMIKSQISNNEAESRFTFILLCKVIKPNNQISQPKKKVNYDYTCLLPKKKKVKPNRCFKRQLIVISNQNIWKSKLLNFSLLIVLHFLSNKYNNKGYDCESMNSNVLSSHFPSHHYLAIHRYSICSVKLFSLEGQYVQ